MLIYDDLRGVPAVRRSLLVLLGSVVREVEMNFAVLLQVLSPARAPPTLIHETADSCKTTHFESFHLAPHARHAPDNFVSGDHGEDGATPLVSCLMDVRVTDAAVKNFDEHILWTWFAPLKGEWLESRGRAFGCVSTCR